MKIKNPLVSILIPFYNPKYYFNDFLESVSKQTYKNIEIVLVDDGSEEAYNKTAKEFVRLCKNRILVTKKNGGVASARQAGLEVATGDLIIHADADDLLPERAIELLVDKMISTCADIVVGGYIVKTESKEKYAGVSEIETYKGFVEGLISGRYHGSLCNKLMKKELYRENTFEKNVNYMEDKLILARIFSCGPYVISFLDQPVYIYRQNANSATYNLTFDSIKSSVTVVNIIYDLYQGRIDPKLLNDMLKRQRVFEIYHSAKKGINVFSYKDLCLIKDNNTPFRFKVALWLISKNMLFSIRFMSKFKI